MAVERLKQTLSHLRTVDCKPVANHDISLLHGPREPALLQITLSELLLQRANADPDREATVFPENNQRYTYQQLYDQSIKAAKGLIHSGIQRGDHVGILAGNCPQYVELFFATSHVGAALVVLNNTYTTSELRNAVKASCCKLVFISEYIGKANKAKSLSMFKTDIGSADLPDLRNVLLLKSAQEPGFSGFRTYEKMVMEAESVSTRNLKARIEAGRADDVCNLQFTSGTTGNPKAALLTHSNLINNGLFTGDRMRLTPNDRICCPPPLFHCFGLVLGLLAVITHGSTIIFPSETFNPALVLKAVIEEKCTGLHGVPAMFSAELDLLQDGEYISSLRTGIAGGAPVPRQLMEDLRSRLNLLELTNTYGMTETSPASFMTFTDDPIVKRLSTVGKVLPHTSAKVIDLEGQIVPRGKRGELCVAGFSVMKGYWRNPEKTAEAMHWDENGVLWMHTGDQVLFDEEGYCHVTGRIKDTIIRGGENIFPSEIEERLVQHASISQASVIGVPEPKYGEVVGAFLQQRSKVPRPSNEELREFVGQTLGRHKVPVHIFWLEAGEVFPQTGSGKIKKHILRERGAKHVL